jgi:serine-type D-Ala-D-Ala carboxypeptidase/endopeptidase
MKSSLLRCVLALAGIVCCGGATALSAEDLQARLRARWEGDRTGVCLLAAVTDATGTVRGRFCALRRAGAGPGEDEAFEIGSISKTMTAFLVARLVEQGRWSLDDPIALHLPAGTEVPQQAERQILVRDLVTHRASLPSLPPGFAPRNPSDPYADLTEAGVLQALARTPLRAPLGSRYEYTNFGMMVLSLAVAQAYGGDLEAALRHELWAPLGMRSSHIAKRATDTVLARGRLPSGAWTAAWTITPKLAGVGMVKATLDDMVRYARLAAGLEGPPALAATMRRSQQVLAGELGMNWMHATRAGRAVVLHAGATGGFSSIVVAEPGAQRAVVVLADTSLMNLGGVQDVAFQLLGLPMGARGPGGSATVAPRQGPRLAVPMPAALRQAAIGEYELRGLSVRVFDEGGRVMVQAAGQPALEMKADSYGDMYFDAVDALLTPVIEDGRVVRFIWRQGGGMVEGVRKGVVQALTAQRPEWQPWAGEYQLAPQFTLKVFERQGQLMVQATGQSAFETEAAGKDRITIASVGAEIEFLRAADGSVRAAVLHQNGRVIEGARLPSVAAKP